MTLYCVVFKVGSFTTETRYISVEDIVAAAKKAERIRKDDDYEDILSITRVGELTE